MAEMRRNYETVLSWLRPSGINKSQGDILPKKKQSNQIPDLSDLPATRYRVTSGFVDELLDSLTTSDRTSRSQSPLSSIPDLSDLPSTRYRVSYSFIDDMLDDLMISKEGYNQSTNFADSLLDSL